MSVMEKLKIGLLGIGAFSFIGAIASYDLIAVIGTVLFTCVVALATIGVID
jgi:hypothetical protein